MAIANWQTQCYNVIQSLLFNNSNRVVSYRVRDLAGGWCDRATLPAPTRRLFETEAPPERTCLETIQFVHHVLIPPGGRHVAELHIHPDAEELVVVTSGRGAATVGAQTIAINTHDVVHIPTGAEHKVENTGADMLGLLFINVPTGEGLVRLLATKSKQVAQLPGGAAPGA